MANSLSDLPAYQQPGVEVIEDFTGVTPALALFSLTNINVGPAFQVVNRDAVGTYNGTSHTYDYESQIDGTLIDTRAADATDLISYPVTAYLRNITISYIDSTAGAVNVTTNANILNDATSGAFADTVAGDVIVIDGSVHNDGNYTVRQVISANSVKVNETFAMTETSLPYSIVRNLATTSADNNLLEYKIPASTVGLAISADGVTLPAGISFTDSIFGSTAILTADVKLSYRAQRLELSADVAEFTSPQELQAAFGTDQIVPENPLAFAAFIALNNQASATNVLALDFQYLGNEVLSYADAFDILENNDMYAINVLTQNPAVHTALLAHVDAMSQPTAKLERVGIVNHQLVTTAVVVDEATTTGEGISGASGGPFTTFTDTVHGAFLTDSVVPGMFLKVSAPSQVVGRFKIASVTSQTVLVLSAGPATSHTNVTYTIEKDLSLTEQANVIAAYAASLGDRRLVCTWPDIVSLPSGSTIRQLPGYFLGCSLGALTTALPTQQGFTKQTVSLYTGVVHSTKYFKPSQLDAIAKGGVMIFVQDQLNVSAVYIRHQLTTDRTAVKFQEFSITKNVDFIAKFVRTNHGQFPGHYNIVDNAFDDLKTNAQALIGFLRDSTKRPKIGGVIKSGKLLSAVQDPNEIDGIVEKWQLDIPIPLNNLSITIFV